MTTDVKGAGAGADAPAPVPVGTTQLLDLDEVGGRVERTELPGGLRVLTETMPGVLSATLGIWVGVGSRDEHPAVAGSSHFLEHLLFKGTTTRSALEIATAMDAVGGEMNAFTAKEHTCYYANVLASDLPLAVTLLSDLVTEALQHGGRPRVRAHGGARGDRHARRRALGRRARPVLRDALR